MSFTERQLHPLLLCCPFMYRIFAKPLGYAGDYEMMNMIVRNDNEGGSLFAKLLQAYILNQAPAIAVRNRVDYFAGYSRLKTSNSVPNNDYTNGTFAGRIGILAGPTTNLTGTIRRIDTEYGSPTG